MNTKSLQIGFAILAAIAMVVPASADDRDLLRYRGAKPNVLMIVDSSGSITRDIDTDSVSFIAGGEDPHAKLTQMKYALGRFFDTNPDFNLGFTFYERENLDINHHVFMYRFDPAGDDLVWQWRIRVNEDGSIRGFSDDQTEDYDAGELVRLGSDTPNRGGSSYFWDPQFGATGLESYADWSRYTNDYIGGQWVYGNSGSVYFDGSRYTGEYRVDTYLVEPHMGTSYYYPAYDWNSAVQTALDDFIAIHDVYADTIYDPDATSFQRKLAYDTLKFGRADLQAVLDSNQIGSEYLTVVSELRRCHDSDGDGNVYIRDTDGTCNDGTWVSVATETRTVISAAAGDWTPHDIDPADAEDFFTYPETAVPLDYNGGGAGALDYDSSCNGIQHEMVDGLKVPVIPVPSLDEEDVDLAEVMRGYLRTQPQMQFFFPTKPTGMKYWPRYWDGRDSLGAFEGHPIFVTDRVVVGTGSTPLGRSLSDAYTYYRLDIKNRDDELADCRANFVILITDGINTCDGDPCSAADDLGDINVPVYAIGYGMTSGADSLDCIAERSGGHKYAPNNVDQLIEALRSVGQSIDETARGFAAPMVPSVDVSSDQKAFLATFLPLGSRSIWQGHLRAYAIDPTTGTIPTTDAGHPLTEDALWNVGDQLTNMDESLRMIYYGDDADTGMPGSRWSFTYPSVSEAERDKLKDYMAVPTMSDSDLAETMAFIRGDRDTAVYGNEKLGDIFHGVPGLQGPPSCYTCWLINQHGYRDNLATPEANDGFRGTHFKRRQVLYAAADDGLLHAIDAGVWDVDEEQYDDGTGDELFAWAPRAVMPAYSILATTEDHLWTVDGTPTVADVYIDRDFSINPVADDREWRSVLLFGLRRGGRSITCLDVTQPDTYDSDGVPDPVASNGDRSATCGLGGGSCSGPWPAFRWEFTDISDENLDGAADLGQTWSRPLVAFVKVEVGSGADTTVEQRSVAIFGGGFDPEGFAGRHLYIVDIETGEILLKQPSAGMVPSDVAGLDLNLDGVLERLYWTDTEGYLYRLDMGEVATLDGDGRINNWAVKTIFSAGPDQPLYMRAALSPVAYSPAGEAYIALAFGAGDRADIFTPNEMPHHFYMLVDWNDYDTVGELTPFDMQPIPVDAPYADANFLQDPAVRGWYLILGENEKVNTPALILNQMVIFSTFKPAEGIVTQEDPENPDNLLCRRAGDAKTYVVNFYNGNPIDPDGRFIDHGDSTAIATAPTVYLGADGRLHVIQALDDLRLVTPVGAQAIDVTPVNWRQE